MKNSKTIAGEDQFPYRTRQTLINRIKDKYDDQSWEEFVYYYRQYIYNIIRSMNLNHHDAVEIVQLVMIKLWKKLPEFKYQEHRGKFRNWLHTVTSNQVKDFIRKKGAALSYLPDTERRKEEGYLKDIEVPEIEKLAEREWKVYISNLAWKRIEQDFEESVRNCFLLMAEGLKAAEVAERCGVSESTVYVYKKRIQDRLAREIARLNNDLM